MEKRVSRRTSASVAQLVAHLRTPLFRNGYALLFSSASTSALGLVYWVLAARYYSADQVGLDSAIIAVMTGIAAASQLSLNTALARFVPVAGAYVRRFVLAVYLVSALVAAVTTLAIVLGLGSWSPTLQVLRDQPLLFALFTLATIGWSVFTLQDSVLIGLRQALWVPIENIVFAVGKLALLVAFAGQFAQHTIFASWVIPAALALVPINWLVFWRFIPRRVMPATSLSAGELRRAIGTFVAGNYPGTLFLLISTTALPLMISAVAGPSGYAYFYMPWLIATSLQLIPQNLTTSFMVEAAHDPDRLWTFCRQVLKQTLRLVVPLVVVIALGAPLILRIFGSSYAAEGVTLLRLLALATVPNTLVLLYLNVARVYNRVRSIVLVQAGMVVLDLGLSFLGLREFGITGIGYAWVASRSTVALVLLVTQLRPLFRRRAGAQSGIASE